MSKKMLVNATLHEENRVAIVEDGILTELEIEVAGHEPTKGNIYRAVVVRVETGLQAAFVDYGAGRMGFLQIDEVNYKTVKPDYKPAEDGRRPRITDLLQRGQEILVQIIKEERGTKGAALTTYLSLAGRYMVIMPDSKTRGVSRKAESDSLRKELKNAMSSIDMVENVGYIVRTAALNQTREELERDYKYLIRLYESIVALNKKVKAPALLYKESNVIIRSIRDYFTTEMDEVLIDDPDVFQEVKDFFQMVMPDQAKLVKLHQERRPIFSKYQIEDQIETLTRNKVPLPSGGSIVIDPTEALVAIDVNSGKMASEQGVEATATKTNIEAAREVGRQLRLRDLGGLVVIDFIDMRENKHAREVEDELRKSMKNDKAKVSVGRISQFGLLEMSRQRIKGTLAEGTYLPCPHCQGTGKLKSPETQAASLLRKIHASAAKGLVSKIDAHLPLDVAAYLLNHKREDLVEMERDHNLQIHIHGNRDFTADQLELEIIKREKEKPSQPEYVAAGLLPAPVEEPADKTKSDAPQETAEEGQKRRRRRRRKPAATEEQKSTEQVTTESDADSTLATGEPVVVEDTTEQSEKPAEQTAPQKPKRTRRSSRKRPEKSPQATEAAVEPTEAEENKPIETDKPAAKPKRRQPRRKPKPAGEEVKADQVAATPESTPEQKASAPPTEPTAENVQVSAPTTPKYVTEPPKTENTTEVKTADVESAKNPETADTVKKKPARRRRKPAAKPAAESAANPSPAEPQKPAEPKEADAKEVKKPGRRRSPQPKKAPAEAQTESSPAPVKENPQAEKAAETPAEQKPKPRRSRPRKKPAEKEPIT